MHKSTTKLENIFEKNITRKNTVIVCYIYNY